MGTLVVNVLGSLLLGFILTLYSFNLIENHWIILLGTGFLGSFTTMSTFVYETMRLGNDSHNMAFINFTITLIFVFIGGFIGQVGGLYFVRRGL